MKLFNFINFQPFNRLKEQMGLDPNYLGNFQSIKINKTSLSPADEIELKTKGIEVNIDEITFLKDGTLGYKDKRVLLYIRDVKYGGSSNTKPKDPKFHISACKMLLQMKNAGRFKQRYVVATREDGKFLVHYIHSDEIIKDKKLYVCQYCLGHIKYRGFDYKNMNQIDRNSIVERFSISEFFDRYPKSLHYDEPLHNDINAPTNTYPLSFDLISKDYRNKLGWRCERCGINLDEGHLRRFLHVHHKDGGQHNNTNSNLEALCIYCHASEPLHAHMKRTMQYSEFSNIWNNWHLKKSTNNETNN